MINILVQVTEEVTSILLSYKLPVLKVTERFC